MNHTRNRVRFHPGTWMLAGLLLGGAWIGCDTTQAPYGGRTDQVAPGTYPHVAVEGSELSKTLVFGPAVIEPGAEDKPMRITQPGRNTSGRDIHVQYRFEFFDNRNRPLGTNQGWRYMRMPSRIEVSFEGAALETEAVDWRLVVRFAK